VGSALPIGLAWPEDDVIAPLFGVDKSFHVYVHIPFCEVRCGYCDFNTYTAKEIGSVSQQDFHNAIISEIERSSKVLSGSGYPIRPISTLFFGGGTPSLFSADQLASIVSALKDQFDFEKNAEITLEANPESTTAQYLEELSQVGINRLSMGVQSFDADVLKTLERVHRPELVAPLVSAAKNVGLATSIDLIYGAPGESIESWRHTLEAAVELGTGHISAYSLIVEPGTKLARQIKSGEVPETDDDLDAEKHQLADNILSEAGLAWYEVSNWGEPSRHNQAYWRSFDWWGYGPGAHSHISGNRFWNLKHPLTYQQAVATKTPVAGVEHIDARTRLEEMLMLELRTKEGVSTSVLEALQVSPHALEGFFAQEFLVIKNQRVSVTATGRLFVDRIVLDLLTN